MDKEASALRRRLRQAGLSDPAINAAWPAWWSDAATVSRSARVELRFALARNLGLSPKSLLGDRVEFVWKDEARFKHLLVKGGATVDTYLLLHNGWSPCAPSVTGKRARGWYLCRRPPRRGATEPAFC